MASCRLFDKPPEESEPKDGDEVITYKNGMRLLLITDPHYHYKSADSDEDKVNQYGYTGNERMKLLVSDILAEHEKAPLDGVLILGDLGGNNYTIRPYMQSGNTSVDPSYYGSEDDTIFQFDKLYLSRLRESGVPVYCLPGNHDTYPPEMWETLFGYKKDHIVELPAFDTAILMLDLYGLEPTNRYFTENRETLAIRKERTLKEREQLADIFETAKDYKHVIVCTHQSAFDKDLLPYVNALPNIDVFLSGDGHRVRENAPISGVDTAAKSYMMGVYSYSIAEEAKAKNGFGIPHVFCTESGEISSKMPWEIDLRLEKYKDYFFRPATEEELSDEGLKSSLVYLVSPEEALSHFRWNYVLLESEKETGDGLRARAIYPERTYYGISQTTGHLLRPHYAMFPSVIGTWTQEYAEEEIFRLIPEE